MQHFTPSYQLVVVVTSGLSGLALVGICLVYEFLIGCLLFREAGSRVEWSSATTTTTSSILVYRGDQASHGRCWPGGWWLAGLVAGSGGWLAG